MNLSVAVATLALAGPGNPPGPSEPAASARVAVAAAEVVVWVGPLHVPARTHYHDHGHSDASADFLWPATGWIQGYRIDVVDGAGRVLSREILHHAGVVNRARRQLGYDSDERLFAVGQETDPVALPNWMGLAMSEGQPLVAYYALVNPADEPIEGAMLRISVRWRGQDTASKPIARRRVARPYHPGQRVRRAPGEITEVRPFAVGAGPGEGGSGRFDVPAGRSSRSAEFTLPVSGRLRALGGHLHDYAREVRIEEVETDRVLVRLEARTDAHGRLESVEQTRFILKPGGLRLHADRRYRVVAVYDNPTGASIPGGAMAYLAGPFIPER